MIHRAGEKVAKSLVAVPASLEVSKVIFVRRLEISAFCSIIAASLD